MSPEWMPSVCNEKSGFLFRHDCYRPPRGECSRCAKPVCDEHQREMAGEVVCIQCAKRRVGKSVEHTGRYRRGHHYDPYYYDPYFYAGYHYHHYHDDWRRERHMHDMMHGDADDFSDADAENLAGGDEDWENDMEES